MKFLLNLRISHKISALMIGLVVGFIIIGITYYLQIGISDQSRVLERETFNYQNQLTAINFLQVKMQSSANQFFATHNPVHATEYNNYVEEIEAKINDAKNKGQELNVTTNLSKATEFLEQHFTIFGKTLEETQAYGISGDLGLRGNLKKLSKQIESELNRNQAGDLLSVFYNVKQTENDLITINDMSYLSTLNKNLQEFEQAVTDSTLPPRTITKIQELQGEYTDTLNKMEASQATIATNIDQLKTLETSLSHEFTRATENADKTIDTILATESKNIRIMHSAVTAIIFVVAMGTAIGIYFIYKSIIFPMMHIQNVIKRVNRGKIGSRVRLVNDDELGELGGAFNKLLDERINQLEEQSKENEKLNNSIISLIQALGRIAQKDLTIKVPVSADVTGTISDAVNLLTKETAKTLHEVQDISREVNDVSDQLQLKSDSVMQYAENERRQIAAMSKALEILATAMNDVAKRSEVADKTATNAIENTHAARQTVLETVNGIRTIRETISETEKRMKRLGDRSQEISGIVNLINTIAERTHILALNASMHAASAGEAGKGFAVVADEVQRLAESARESTDEIASMVKNIRIETSDTVKVMNTLISQVADGSRLAEQAGERMEATETATRQLVENVRVIAEQATQQSDVANRVRDRANVIRNFTENTGKQLAEQKHFTDVMKKFADTLVERVSVFVLPEKVVQKPVVSNVEPINKLQSAG